MTTDTPIYRLVRCPKCRLVLPELADLPLYMCGGCGTVLQAKRRKDAGKSMNSSLRETDAAQMNSLDQDKESSSSRRKASCASSGECSLDHNDQRDCTISGDCDNELLGSVNFPNDQNEEVLEQNDLKDCSLSGDCDNEQLGGLDLSNEDQNDDFLEQNDQNDFSISGDSDSEQLGGVNLSNDDQNNEQNDRKDFGLSGACDSGQLRGVDLSNEGQNDGSLEQNDLRVFSLSGSCDSKQLRGVDLSSEDHSYEMHHNESYERNIEQNGVPKEACSPVDLSHRHSKELSPLGESNTEVVVNDENSPIARANSDVERNDESSSNIERSSTKKLSPLAESNKEVDVNDESSPIARAKSDVESNDESNSTIKRSSAKKPVVINRMRQVVTAHGTARETISSDMLLSSPTEQREHYQEGIAYAFDRVRSTDTLETTDFINPSSELSGKLIDLSKSPTTRSYHAYYDGSSFDEMDDQFPNHYRHSFDHHRHPPKNSNKVPNHDVPVERPRRNKFLAPVDAEMQHQATKFSSSLSDKMHEWNQDELKKPIGLGYRGGKWRLERDEYPSWMPSYQRGSPIGFESGSPSNQFRGSSSNELRNEFHCDVSIHLRNKSEQEKRKLLRMINELQDQLNRAYNLNEETQGRDSASIARENHMPMYHDHKALEEQGFYNLNYPMLPVRVRQESNWSQQRKFLHKPFSGEATYARHHMDSCLCFRPSDSQNLAQLPPFDPFHNKGRCRIHPSQNFHTSYGSCPSSPQQHLDSEFPFHSRETKSDNQRHKDHGVKQYLREKQYSGKKHLRPIAGAAPLITCHHCLKQLQLPADFLIFRRRCHRLRCGSCSEVIKFSVKNGTHLVPYLPNFKNPPPSEIDEYSYTTDRRNLASASHPSESLKVGPVSYSDDYSFSKSCSSDIDPASFTPSHLVPGNEGDRKIPSDSLKIKQDRKKSFSQESQDKNKNPVEGYMSSEPSASTSKARRMSSEIEEVPVPPLHPVPGNARDRKIPRDSLKIKQDRKKSFSKESQDKNKNPVEGCMSAEPSASTSKARRMSLEIEEVPVPRRSTSPLHRLMGYSSPSEMIKGSGPAG